MKNLNLLIYKLKLYALNIQNKSDKKLYKQI